MKIDLDAQAIEVSKENREKKWLKYSVGESN